MRIAVTGGNGEMGRSLVPFLMEQGHGVVNIDRVLPPLPPLRTPDMPDYMRADMTDFGDVVAALEGCDAVVHLAAHRSPLDHPHPVVYSNNTAGSYNVLYAAAALGIQRVCLASSVNAIGGVFSRQPRYDYFPLDENHPTYAEDPYSLSKWVLEQQADAFARRHEWMAIASLRFHWLVETREQIEKLTAKFAQAAIRHLWAYVLFEDANRACLLSLTAGFEGHENFYIAAPVTAVEEPSARLAEKHYPQVPLNQPLEGNTGFYDCSKARRLLGWEHSEV